MKFTRTAIPGVWIVDLEPVADNRGYFARSYSLVDFADAGIVDGFFVQSNIGFNTRCGTIRGLHWQYPPHDEAKFVRCTRGSIFDVIVDLRPRSETFLKWVGIRLSGHAAVYIPRRCAHGYQTLEDNTEVTYQLSALYAPSSEGGLRWNDPALGIEWPLPVSAMSEKDKHWLLLEDTRERIQVRMAA